MEKITLNQWLHDLKRFDVGEKKGLLFRQVMEATQRGERWTRKFLREAVESGKVSMGWRTVLRVDGNPCHKPVYIFREEEI